ncbi:MAG: restriction endonuclease subunit S [Proteobacteria bacterium]|nr:restriction endonuclease subunit S [Pseudomonadota bacterium]
MAVTVPAGHKRTEVGVIPEDWDVRRVVDIAENKKTRFDDGDWVESEHITDKGFRLIQTGNIGVGVYIEKETKKYIYKDSFEKLKCKELIVGDVLICRLADPAGRACILPELGEVKVITSVDVTIFRPNLDNFNRCYLVQFFSTPKWFELVTEQVGGTTHKRIARGALGKIPVAIPSCVEEQRLIAEALSDADALIESLDQLIAKKRQIKQGAMQELLTGKRRLPGFGGEWEKRALGEIAPLQRGFDLPNSRLEPGLYPVVTSNGVLNHHIAFQVKGPGVVTGRSGTIGAVTFVEENFWPHNTSLWVTSFKANDPKFVFYLYTRVGLERFATGSGVPTLNRNNVHAFKVEIPVDKAEQTAIATLLSDMDTELAALASRLAKARQIKQGMMQELLTGRVRLL